MLHLPFRLKHSIISLVPHHNYVYFRPNAALRSAAHTVRPVDGTRGPSGTRGQWDQREQRPSAKGAPIQSMPSDPAELRSPIKGVYWDSSRSRWLTHWCDGCKRKCKGFSARKYGFKEAKVMAEQACREADVADAAGKVVAIRRGGVAKVVGGVDATDLAGLYPEDFQSRSGVRFVRSRNAWVAQWIISDSNGNPMTVKMEWSMQQYSFFEAKTLAEEAIEDAWVAGARLPEDRWSATLEKIGLTWHSKEGSESWRVEFSNGTTRIFSVEEYGSEKAAEEAAWSAKLNTEFAEMKKQRLASPVL